MDINGKKFDDSALAQYTISGHWKLVVKEKREISTKKEVEVRDFDMNSVASQSKLTLPILLSYQLIRLRRRI